MATVHITGGERGGGGKCGRLVVSGEVLRLLD